MWHASNPLELVHKDLCYINNPSLRGARYVLKFIDDLSQFTWFYLFKNKSHVFKKFNDFRALAEKQCGQLVKCLESDIGGEYVSRHFEDYLLHSSISSKRFVPHTPQ